MRDIREMQNYFGETQSGKRLSQRPAQAGPITVETTTRMNTVGPLSSSLRMGDLPPLPKFDVRLIFVVPSLSFRLYFLAALWRKLFSAG